MDMTLDYNTELLHLKPEQGFALALATSLLRDASGAGAGVDGAEDTEEKGAWRPDGKGQRGLEEDYDYVMYGKVLRANWLYGAWLYLHL